jgi:hypothetical protein
MELVVIAGFKIHRQKKPLSSHIAEATLPKGGMLLTIIDILQPLSNLNKSVELYYLQSAISYIGLEDDKSNRQKKAPKQLTVKQQIERGHVDDHST